MNIQIELISESDLADESFNMCHRWLKTKRNLSSRNVFI